MRRALLVLTLAACHSVANERTPVTPEPKPVASAPAAMTTTPPPPPPAEPAPAPASDGPLAWGTRPAGKGPLYPVVDGVCVHGEVQRLGPSTLFTYGAQEGTWSAGGDTSFARFDDTGLAVEPSIGSAADPKQAEAWGDIATIRLDGVWPSPAILYSDDRGHGRMRAFVSIWSHGDTGWTLLGSWRDPSAPWYGHPAIYKGHVVTTSKSEQGGNYLDAKIKTWPLEKDAAPIPGLASLLRPNFDPYRFVASDTTLYALAGDAIRWLSDGKAGEVSIPELYRSHRFIGATSTRLYLLVADRLVVKIEGGKLSPVNLKLPVQVALKSVSIAPNGDLWAITSKSSIVVLHGDQVTETQLPKPAAPRPAEQVLHWPLTGKFLAGVEVDDPYAIGEGGSVFHLDGGTWKEIELPAPPFAANGKYQAQALTVPAKGDLIVNAGYAEKGVGWRIEERYRAILRTKKPNEVLRCNEANKKHSGSGVGFMSFPPIATDACTTPFVVLLRIGLGVTSKEPEYPFDRKSDYPSVRDAIKGMNALGTSVDLVELVSGDQRYLGARVPSVAAGKALAEAVVKKVKIATEVRPEIVCGTPKEERIIHVDVKTGNAS